MTEADEAVYRELRDGEFEGFRRLPEETLWLVLYHKRWTACHHILGWAETVPVIFVEGQLVTFDRTNRQLDVTLAESKEEAEETMRGYRELYVPD